MVIFMPARWAEEAEKRLNSEWHGWPEVRPVEDEHIGIVEPVPGNERSMPCWHLRPQYAGTAKEICTTPAGRGTWHDGVGRCSRHDNDDERGVAAWMMAHLIARELDVDPLQGLLLAVRRAAAWSGFYQSKLAEVTDDEELRPGGAAWDWVAGAERTTAALARWSQVAVAAGVAAMLVQQARTEGAAIARVLNASIESAGLSVEQEARMREALRRELLALDQAVGVGHLTAIEAA